jgi:hypothetical protein
VKPSVGRIVHYVSHGTPIREDGMQAYAKQCRAAIVTEVDRRDSYLVGLDVFNPTGLFFHSLPDGGCNYHSAVSGEPAEWSCSGMDHPGGTWHWPERVDE